MPDAMDNALRILRAEHRSLGAVLHALNATVAGLAEGGAAADFALLWRMLYYIEAYPDRLHHPKEDRELFPRLRALSADAARLVDELEAQHAESARRLNDVRVALGHHEAGVPGARERLRDEVNRYAEFYWRHMLLEERELLPLAERALSPDDWAAVERSFAANADPLQADTADAFWNLLRDIVRRTPSPLGVGRA